MREKVADELLEAIDKGSARLRAIDDTVAAVRVRQDAWSVKEIVGHLIDSAANNHQRFVRAQTVDELALPNYEQDAWVRQQDYQHRPWRELIELWALYNRHLAHVIRHVPDRALMTTCRIGAGEPVTLQYVVEDYVRHLRHHLQQIEERLTT
jgi:hypothetical protein